MKTADLIPLILLELNTGDKYGFELTKAVETKSRGKIVIKQPTLYTLLKKLEKSKFISSYWMDSDIGGKRHYYKLTENGKLQVSTLPSYESLVASALADENIIEIDPFAVEQLKKELKVSIMDALVAAPNEPTNSVLPSNEVFSNNELDNSTTLDLTMDNLDILKHEIENNQQNFAENESVSKFTTVRAVYAPKADVMQSQNMSISLDAPNSPKMVTVDDVKFVDYVNFKQSKEYRQNKAISKRMLTQALLTSISLMAVSLLCLLITNFTGRSAWFYTCFISSGLISLCYPVFVAFKLKSIRSNNTTLHNPNISQKFIVSLLVVLIVLIISIMVSLNVDANSISELIGINNFANLYAPVLMSCVAIINVFVNYILFVKKIK